MIHVDVPFSEEFFDVSVRPPRRAFFGLVDSPPRITTVDPA
jgi:hypothetical protein